MAFNDKTRDLGESRSIYDKYQRHGETRRTNCDSGVGENRNGTGS
jgi:hypothetical protein